MACTAINYNVMVSPDISVQLGNPTWPNPNVLTLRTYRARSFLQDHTRVSETAVYYLVLSLVLIFAPEDGAKATIRNYVARNCPSASALIECLFLSLRISYALT